MRRPGVGVDGSARGALIRATLVASALIGSALPMTGARAAPDGTACHAAADAHLGAGDWREAADAYARAAADEACVGERAALLASSAFALEKTLGASPSIDDCFVAARYREALVLGGGGEPTSIVRDRLDEFAGRCRTLAAVPALPVAATPPPGVALRAPVEPVPPGPTRYRAAAWITGGVGLLSAVTAGVLFVERNDARDDRETAAARLDAASPWTAEHRDALHAWSTAESERARLEGAFWAVAASGAALATTSAVLWVLDGADAPPPDAVSPDGTLAEGRLP